MFTNEFNDSFGKIYTSDVYEAAQKNNKWSLAYTLLFALSKNGMNYATDTTGKCSVINKTSLGCMSKIVGTPSDTSGSLIITFKQLCLKINVKTSDDGSKAYPSGIFVTNLAGKTLGTLIKESTNGEATITTTDSAVTFGPGYSTITNWSNNTATDEDKYKVQTATFKDSNGSADCCSLHFWAEDVYLGAIMFFKVKDYFSSKYKYGFGLFKIGGLDPVYKFSDGTDCENHPVFEEAGAFSGKIARTCFFTGESIAGLIGGINGIYQITDGTTTLSSFPENKVSVNGRDFQAVAPGLFARTS